jgi:hypothetical protein
MPLAGIRLAHGGPAFRQLVEHTSKNCFQGQHEFPMHKDAVVVEVFAR